MEQILLAQLDQARRNQAEAAFNEDYAEAALWGYKVEALEDVLSEAAVVAKRDNVVPING
ncbi:hypothetical protein D3C87_1314130 [compost metagenome]